MIQSQAVLCETGSLTTINPWTWLFAIINFIILFFVIKKFFWTKITSFMDARSDSIQQQLDSAAANEKEAEALKAEYTQVLNNAKAEAAKILEDSREAAKKEYNRIIEKAHEDAKQLKAKTREDLEQEHEEMLHSIRGEVTDMTMMAISKLVDESMDSDANRALVERLLKQEEGAA